MEKLSIVIPCYNEEECVEVFYKKLIETIDILPLLTELIFVDDGSEDRTLEIIKKLQNGDKRVKFISFSRNFGKEAAFYAGLKESNGDYVAVMDADLQDPPEMLKDMYSGLLEGYDCVGCKRVDRKGEPKIRSWFAKKFYKVINGIGDSKIVDGARDFRLMKRQMVDAILELSEYDRFSKGIFGWVGFKIKWLSYNNVERVAGKTKFSFKALFLYAVNGIENFSVAPLKFNLFMSLLTFLSAVVIFIVDVVLWSCGKTASIFMCISPLILLLFSALFFGIFIQGEYLKKIYMQTKNRPIYIIREKK